eukprot:GILJ01012074.1.p1 GENE.GILJ01012074.1~~GILJ01012074.1.p1  ORF type:complete len:306 (+),score=18.15 GILJ01012074.1:84-1001(+)
MMDAHLRSLELLCRQLPSSSNALPLFPLYSGRPSETRSAFLPTSAFFPAIREPDMSGNKAAVELRWCHHCRAKKVGVQCGNTAASGRSGPRHCKKVFCHSCLSRYYGQPTGQPASTSPWLCPYCCNKCVCTHCKPNTPSTKSSAKSNSPEGEDCRSSDRSGSEEPLFNNKSRKRVATLLSKAHSVIKNLVDELSIPDLSPKATKLLQDRFNDIQVALVNLSHLANPPPSSRGTDTPTDLERETSSEAATTPCDSPRKRKESSNSEEDTMKVKRTRTAFVPSGRGLSICDLITHDDESDELCIDSD